MQFPYKLNHEIPTMRAMAELFDSSPAQLNLNQTYFMRPATLAPLALYLFENPKASLATASPPIKKLFQTYGLLKSKEPVPIHIFPLRYLKNVEEVICQLERFLPTPYLGAYLKSFLRLLAPATCCGHSNLGGGWLFFSICSSKLMPLDDFRWHLLLDEFAMTGGRFWALQGNRYFDGKNTVEIGTIFPKTWVIFGFSLT